MHKCRCLFEFLFSFFFFLLSLDRIVGGCLIKLSYKERARAAQIIRETRERERDAYILSLFLSLSLSLSLSRSLSLLSVHACFFGDETQVYKTKNKLLCIYSLIRTLFLRIRAVFVRAQSLSLRG